MKTKKQMREQLNGQRRLTARLSVCNACPEGNVCGNTLRSCTLGIDRNKVREADARCPVGKW